MRYPNTEFALVHYKSGNMLVTSDAFSQDFDFEKKDEKSKDEKYDDSESLRTIGYATIRGYSRINPKWMGGENKFIELKDGKVEITSLGNSWSKSWWLFRKMRS